MDCEKDPEWVSRNDENHNPVQREVAQQHAVVPEVRGNDIATQGATTAEEDANFDEAVTRASQQLLQFAEDIEREYRIARFRNRVVADEAPHFGVGIFIQRRRGDEVDDILLLRVEFDLASWLEKLQSAGRFVRRSLYFASRLYNRLHW